MEDINKSFNIKSLQAFAEHTAAFAHSTDDRADLEAGKANPTNKKTEPLLSPVVKTVLLVLAAVLIVVLLIYLIYKKIKKN